MDPDANLKEQLALAEMIIQYHDDGEEADIDEQDVLRLAELVQALNGWIKGGGFLPQAWRR